MIQERVGINDFLAHFLYDALSYKSYNVLKNSKERQKWPAPITSFVGSLYCTVVYCDM